MLEKPAIADERIISLVEGEYGLHTTLLTFLPLGADQGSAVYRVVTREGAVYFLKLRKGFNEIVVTVPLFLQSQGIDAIPVPFRTKLNQYWADFGDYRMILYPFLEGKNGFEMDVTDDVRRELGAVLKRIHTLKIPLELERVIPRENYSSYWRERLQDLQRHVENTTFDEPNAAQLAAFMKMKRDEIRRLIERTEELASILSSKSIQSVLCHTDIHGANILIMENSKLYIVDWDNPRLAPKELDLMFVGGGIDTLWESEREESVFYEGYGKAEIDFTVMAYYRYERVIEDLAAYGEQLLLTDEGGTDREPAYRGFASNFEPGGTIEIAKNTDRLLS